MKIHVGDIRRKEMFWANHNGLHTADNIQWREYFGLSHEGSWSHMKAFKKYVKPTNKWRVVILRKASLTTCGTKEGIEKSLREPPLIIKECSHSTLDDHSWWKALRIRYKLKSRGTFGDDFFPLLYSCSYPIVWFHSIPYTLDDHDDRLEFLEHDKEAIVLKLC
jgi:hypothetical protein